MPHGPFTRQVDGETILVGDVNELQVALENTPTVAEASVNDFPFSNNRWHGPLAHPRGSVAPYSASAVAATVANRYALFAPFHVPTAMNLAEVRMAVTAAAAGGLINISLYSATAAVTAQNLLVNFGDVSGTTVGQRNVVLGTPYLLSADTWYVAMLLCEATAEGMEIDVRQSTTGIFGTDPSGFPCGGRTVTSGLTSIVPPSTFTFGSFLTTFVPRVEFRMVTP